MVLGGAAALAPKYLPTLRRRLRPLFGSGSRKKAEPAPLPQRRNTLPAAPRHAPVGFGIKRAIAKTITFRIIVTTLDFTSNYVVIGEVATAAGLSAFALVAGPLFYFVHETAWNRFGPAGTGVDLPPLRPPGRDTQAPDRRGFTISRALAKTITFRSIATVMDFTATYVVVRDVATAAGLSAFGFVVGPFVYLGHEKVWDYYAPQERTGDLPAPTNLVPSPAT
jgi:uncharacterized membrane protein